MATNVYDSSKISYYEPFVSDKINLETKQGNLYGFLSVKIQYIPNDTLFLCPACNNLSSYTPIMLFICLQSVVLRSPDPKQRNLKMILRVGSEVASTSDSPTGEFGEHFMIEYPRISSMKNLTITIYQDSKEIGKEVIHLKDLLDGSLYDRPISNNVISHALALLQLVYPCSDCIVERETADGELDIPMLPVKPAPRSSAAPAASRPVQTPARALPPAAQTIELQSQSIPGMSSFVSQSQAQAQPLPQIQTQAQPFVQVQTQAMPQNWPQNWPQAPNWPQAMPQVVPVRVEMEPRREMAMLEPAMLETTYGRGNDSYYQVAGYQETAYGQTAMYAY